MSYQELPEGTLPPVMIHEAPVRFWHWAQLICILVLSVTGYLIGSPMTSVAGDTSHVYVMGRIRFIHFVCGEIFALLYLYRVFLAFFFGGYARQLFVPEIWSKNWWKGFRTQILWNTLLLKKAPRYLGLNPLGMISAFALCVIPSLITILTGFGMMAEGLGRDSWLFAAFGWVIYLFDGSLDLHLVHRLCMWTIVCFAIMHIYVVIRDDVMSRQTSVSSMLSGIRLFHD